MYVTVFCVQTEISAPINLEVMFAVEKLCKMDFDARRPCVVVMYKQI